VALIRTDVSAESTASIIRVKRIRELRLLATPNVVPSSPILVTLMIKKMRSSETSVLTRASRHHIQEDVILHYHHRENLKSYIALTGWAL
jgi:hypothetical protein